MIYELSEEVQQKLLEIKDEVSDIKGVIEDAFEPTGNQSRWEYLEVAFLEVKVKEPKLLDPPNLTQLYVVEEGAASELPTGRRVDEILYDEGKNSPVKQLCKYGKNGWEVISCYDKEILFGEEKKTFRAYLLKRQYIPQKPANPGFWGRS